MSSTTAVLILLHGNVVPALHELGVVLEERSHLFVLLFQENHHLFMRSAFNMACEGLKQEET